jgi:hypothetical protein
MIAIVERLINSTTSANPRHPLLSNARPAIAQNCVQSNCREQFSLNRRCRVIDTRSQYARRVLGHGFKRLTHCGQQIGRATPSC